MPLKKPRIMKRLLAILPIFAALASQAAPPPFPPVPAAIEGADTFVYKRGPGFELPVFVFRPSGGPPGERPAVVFFHGSGWQAGSVLQFAGYARLLARHGLVAALAEYRVKEGYGATPFDGVADAKSVIRWLRVHARELGIDPKRVVAAGGSAGAHLAAAAAIFEDRFDDPGDDLAVSARPDALVLFVPILDTTESGYAEGVPLFGGRERELSPLHHLKPGLPPALFLYGAADPWVPRASVERFAREARALGNECELVPFTGRTHFFYNHPEYLALRPHLPVKAPGSDFVTSFYLVERFLYRHGFLTGLPEVQELPE
jgi:acetyl esterase/lipase